jgi:hypothetical protein
LQGEQAIRAIINSLRGLVSGCRQAAVLEFCRANSAYTAAATNNNQAVNEVHFASSYRRPWRAC